VSGPALTHDIHRLDAYRATRIEPDLRRVCGEAIALVNRLLEAMPDESDAEARVFYLKMKVCSLRRAHCTGSAHGGVVTVLWWWTGRLLPLHRRNRGR